MKTLHDIKEIEEYLQGKMSPQAQLLFEARMLIDQLLKLQVACQRRLYAIITSFGRRMIKSEVKQLHDHLFNDPSRHEFRESIQALFSEK